MPDSERDERQDEPATGSRCDVDPQDTRALLTAVLERASDAFVALDTNWRYIHVNKHAGELFGRRPEDLIGRHIWTEFPEGVGQPFHLAYERAMREQVVVEMEGYYEPWDRWFENRIYPAPNGIAIFFHDITDRKRVEQEARASAALVESQNRVLEAIAAGMPLEYTLYALLSAVEAQCPGMLSSILLFDTDGTHVRHVVTPSLPEGFIRAIDGASIGPNAGFCSAAASHGEPVIVEDIASDPRWHEYRDPALAAGLRACWSIPILDVNGGVLGTFACYFREPRLPSAWHHHVIEVATHTAAVAIRSARAAEALRESEQRLRTAVEGGNVGIWECDVSTGRVVLSDHLKLMFGWSLDTADVAMQQVIDAIHPADRERFKEVLRRAIGEGSTLDIEYRMVGPDGLRWLASKAVIQCDERQKPLRTMGVTLDVTAQKRAEEAISKREKQLAEAQRIAHVGSYEWDAASRTLAVSAELTRIFGLPPEGFPVSIDEFVARVHPEDRERTRRIIEHSAREQTPFDFEHRILRPDGSIRLVQSQGTWKVENGRPAALMGVAHDITERRQAERQLRERELLRTRNEELKAFAYTVSHDLRAPLRGISGYAGELRRRYSAGLDERGRFCVDRILAAAHNLDRLIDDLLQYSRVDAEVVSPADVDLERVVEAILREFRPSIAEWRAEVEVRLSVARLVGWERGIRQVLTNLIDNALKYSRNASPPRVRITSERSGDGIRISVSDNGIGFDMKHHDRMFGLFNRLVSDEQFEGTGAGLAIVKKLIDRMGGTLSAQSKPGSGATFVVELPDAEHDTPLNDPPLAPAIAGEP